MQGIIRSRGPFKSCPEILRKKSTPQTTPRGVTEALQNGGDSTDDYRNCSMLDHWIASLLAPLAFWVLLNGIDDLIIDVAGLVSHVRQKLSADPGNRTPSEEELD